MLLDRLVRNLELRVDPFAVCDVRHGAKLALAGPSEEVLHFVLKGQGCVRTAQGDQPIAANQMIVVPPGLAHSLESDGEGGGSLSADGSALPSGELNRVTAGEGEEGLLVACGRIAVTYGGIVDLFQRLEHPLVVDFSETPSVRAAFAALLEEQARARPGSAQMATALMNQCFIQLLRQLCETGECRLPWLAALEDERLARALDAILERPEDPHTLEGLGRAAGMSRTAFAERFHEVFGQTAMEVVKRARLACAAKLLTGTELPVKTIAGRVGFQSRSHFSRAFTDHFGSSPAEFRAASEVGARCLSTGSHLFRAA
jgi:AraC-like DNA-binding protein